MALLPTLSLTEAQALTALRSFLLGVISAGTGVYRAEQNEVAEPQEADFVLMTPLLQERLETNDTTYADNILMGSIAATTLTVSAVARGAVAIGGPLFDTTGTLAANTQVTAQLTGAPGGIGAYTIAPSQTVASETMYCGVRSDLVPTKLTVQLDIHGPNSGNNTKIVEALFRSEYATSAFATFGFDVAPLYCGEARQTPFMNAENNYEYRWTIDACLQVNPIVGTPQQFADQVEVGLIEVDATYPP